MVDHGWFTTRRASPDRNVARRTASFDDMHDDAMDEMVMHMDHASRNSLRQTSHRGRAAIRRTQARYEVEMGHEALRFIARQRRPDAQEIVHFLHRPDTVLMLMTEDDDERTDNLVHILRSYRRTGKNIPIWLLEWLHVTGNHQADRTRFDMSVFNVFNAPRYFDDRALHWMFANRAWETQYMNQARSNAWRFALRNGNTIMVDGLLDHYGFRLTPDRLRHIYLNRPALWAHLVATGRVPPNFTP